MNVPLGQLELQFIIHLLSERKKKLALRVVLNRHENNSLHFKYLFTEKLDENVS